MKTYCSSTGPKEDFRAGISPRSIKGNIGLVGLAIMGSDLARNLASGAGTTVAVLNRSREKTATMLGEHPEDREEDCIRGVSAL